MTDKQKKIVSCVLTGIIAVILFCLAWYGYSLYSEYSMMIGVLYY